MFMLYFFQNALGSYFQLHISQNLSCVELKAKNV